MAAATTSKAIADAISPAITGEGTVYSKEPAHSSFYGTGVAGRLNEASVLRFNAEEDMAAQNYDQAIRKLSKALQFDPADPTGHVMYARALSAKIDSARGNINPEDVNQALREWKVIWHHDADFYEQLEGRRQAKRLQKIARALEKKQDVSKLVAHKEKKSSDDLFLMH